MNSREAPQFVDLPEDGRNTLGREWWAALAENPGKWAIWPGSGNVYSVANWHSRNGMKFEGRVRGDKRYIRAVSR